MILDNFKKYIEANSQGAPIPPSEGHISTFVERNKELRLWHQKAFADFRVTVACVAHDGMKHLIADIAKSIASENVRLVATGTTGKVISDAGVEVERLNSGPRGGDAQIAARVSEGAVHAVIFLIDPTQAHPHQVDVSMLLRICNVYDVPLATNPSSARLLSEQIAAEIRLMRTELLK